MDTSRHYFRIKGKKAEEYLQEVAQQTFLDDWCYLNPKLPNGKELCDLLVVFGDTAIIWQVKDIKIRRDGRYSESEVEKNFRQLSGAKRRLTDIRAAIKLVNPRRGEESFDPRPIKKIYLLSAFLGEPEDYFPFIEERKGSVMHIFTRDFTNIVLNELDTISDFVAYLEEKEKYLSMKKHMIINGGEQELLALYLHRGRSLSDFYDKDTLIIEEGSWNKLINKPEFKAKNEENRISYCWDRMIAAAHEVEYGSKDQYELIARELARSNRFERRCLSVDFREGLMKANDMAKDGVLRRTMVGENNTYCFLFIDISAPRELRREMLYEYCQVGRVVCEKNHTVVGIATEKNVGSGRSYDFVYLHMPVLSKKYRDSVIRMAKDRKILQNSEWSGGSVDEYPSPKE